MKPQIKVKTTVDKTALLRGLLEKLTEEDVYIGVPPEKNERPGSPIGNAALSYIHEYGSSANNIPARPHLFPIIRSKRNFVIKRLEKAWEKTLQGDRTATHNALEGIGAALRNAVRARFKSNNWRPLSKKAVAARLKKDAGPAASQMKIVAAKTRERGKEADWSKRRLDAELKAAGARFYPLLDTGTLRDAHDYVIKKRGGHGGVFGVLTADTGE